MRVLIVSGIWPPDVGGPASHAPDVADYLAERGHDVEVVTTADAQPAAAYPIRFIPRRLPRGIRHLRGVEVVRARARGCDVVYTTGMFGRSFAGATLAERPYVVKLTADPAFERARRRGVVGGNVDEFQRLRLGATVSALRLARNVELRRAAHVFCPSSYLRDLAIGWGVPGDRVSVLPNPIPSYAPAKSRDDLRQDFALNGQTLVFAGRLTVQKSLEVALAAVAKNSDVTLLIAGEGDERDRLEQAVGALGLGSRVRFLGAQPRDRVLDLFYAADAAILSSSWENFPHTVVEALAVGTPVLATTVGGVTEVVRDGENGLLFTPGDVGALSAGIARFFADDRLRARLRAGAAPSVGEYGRGAIFQRLERALIGAASR